MHTIATMVLELVEKLRDIPIAVVWCFFGDVAYDLELPC